MSDLSPFDSQWFKDQLRAVGSNQIDLAAALGCTSGNACRLLSGQYAIRLKDVAVLASVLRVPRRVVIERAGLSLTEDILSQSGEQSDVQ